MKPGRRIVLLILLTLAFACEDPISIELPSEGPFVVVEGWVTDQPGPYRVKLSETLPFDSRQTGASISNAQVEIVNQRQERFLLREDPVRPGEYVTDSSEFRGAVGHSYRVEIRWNDKFIVSAPELLREVPSIDTITYEFVRDVFIPETLSFTSGYLVTGFVEDPEGRSNYYRWRLSENGIPYKRPEDLILITDRFFNGKRFGYELSSRLFQKGDTITIEQHSLSQGAFNFLRNLNIQAIGLGKATSTPPARVRGNLRNMSNEEEIILGYFGASSVVSATVIIEPLQ